MVTVKSNSSHSACLCGAPRSSYWCSPAESSPYCAVQVSTPRMESRGNFPKVHAGESGLLALNPDTSTPEALCLTSVSVSKWGDDTRALAQTGAPYAAAGCGRPVGGVWFAFGCCFRSAYSPLDKMYPRSSLILRLT